MRDNLPSKCVDFGSMPQENVSSQELNSQQNDNKTAQPEKTVSTQQQDVENQQQSSPQQGSTATVGLDQGVTYKNLFEQGLALQQQKKWDEALHSYQLALKDIKKLDQNPDQSLTGSPNGSPAGNPTGKSSEFNMIESVIYHNMSTLAYEKADYLMAYIWSKKAIKLDTQNKSASQAFNLYSQKFSPPKVPHQISGFENLEKLLSNVSFDVFSVLSIIFLFFALKLFFQKILLAKTDTQNSQSGFLNWKMILFLILFFTSLTGSLLKWSFDQKQIATILIDKTGIQTAAGENKSIIYEAQAGTEVEILEISQEYAKVRYPGAFSGWVQLKNLEIF